MAAVFLPVLTFLFGLAFPLDWLDPPTTHCSPPWCTR